MSYEGGFYKIGIVIWTISSIIIWKNITNESTNGMNIND